MQGHAPIAIERIPVPRERDTSATDRHTGATMSLTGDVMGAAARCGPDAHAAPACAGVEAIIGIDVTRGPAAVYPTGEVGIEYDTHCSQLVQSLVRAVNYLPVTTTISAGAGAAKQSHPPPVRLC